ncbi:cytochrome oxidase subunit III [Flexistipes sp.]|uniref:Cytochrome oxidase subunit III n=1 Tax=Flexistipes sinusarabici TaxID=2352 RepID=A0A3D5Q9N4_FLESI|nr:cytochrome oxidase subunit III [Flexistipes sp.]MEC9492134.1 hypothetical protein [Flexistipes sp.]HCW92384.1 cytochrome oxidase subunit III [Flexistipes sinusarabici]
MSNERIYIIGWFVFIISAVFFILSSIENDDPFAFWGGVSFLFACIIFLLPLLLRRR